jgi:hypothetical protein
MASECMRHRCKRLRPWMGVSLSSRHRHQGHRQRAHLTHCDKAPQQRAWWGMAVTCCRKWAQQPDWPSREGVTERTQPLRKVPLEGTPTIINSSPKLFSTSSKSSPSHPPPTSRLPPTLMVSCPPPAHLLPTSRLPPCLPSLWCRLCPPEPT